MTIEYGKEPVTETENRYDAMVKAFVRSNHDTVAYGFEEDVLDAGEPAKPGLRRKALHDADLLANNLRSHIKLLGYNGKLSVMRQGMYVYMMKNGEVK